MRFWCFSIFCLFLLIISVLWKHTVVIVIVANLPDTVRYVINGTLPQDKARIGGVNMGKHDEEQHKTHNVCTVVHCTDNWYSLLPGVLGKYSYLKILATIYKKTFIAAALLWVMNKLEGPGDHWVSSALSFIGGVHSHRRESAAWNKFDMVWLYRSPVPVGWNICAFPPKPFLIYDFAPDPIQISLYKRKILF